MRAWLASLSIRARFILMMLVVVYSAAAVGYGSMVYWHLAAQRATLTDFAGSISGLLAQDFARIVILNDVSVAADTSARLQGFPVLHYLVLFDPAGKPRYQFARDPERTRDVPKRIPEGLGEGAATIVDGTFKRLEPVAYAGRDIGVVYVELEAESWLGLLRRDALALIFIAFAVLALAYPLARYFANSFNRPILRLLAFLDGIGHDIELAQPVVLDEPNERNEFGRLYRGVDEMLGRLRVSNEELLIAAAAFEAPDGMMITNADGSILKVNQGFTRITGYRAEEVVGKKPSVLSSGRHEPLFYEHMWRSLRETGRWEGEIWNRNRAGDHFPCRLTIQTVWAEDGSARYYVAAISDISLQKAAEAQVEYLDYFDPLTGHANRRHLVQKLCEVIAAAASERKSLGALICLDISDLKRINDSFGHAAGDIVLIEIGQRLRSLLGFECFIARLVGDEFAVVAERLAGSVDEASYQVEIMVHRLIKGLEQPYRVGEQTIRCVPRAGVVLFDGGGVNAETLIERADTALHQAKAERERSWCFFDPELQRSARRHLEMQHHLERALANRELELHYQIQVDADGTVVGCEALARWLRAEGGPISPGVFIPLAEHCGLIEALGDWVLEEACAQIVRWRQQGWERLQVAVNVSAQQFARSDFVDRVRSVLERSGAPAAQLKLELTESVMLQDTAVAVDKMKTLRGLGLSISLDDFGTGYSSLHYLRQLPVDQIKIDQSFVRDLIGDPVNSAIVRSILTLGAAVGFEVIAEGVENSAQHRALVDLGCRVFQGYYFGRPCPSSEFPRSV